MSIVCRFKFPEDVSAEAIEAQLTLAIVAAECAYGQAKVRINAAYCISRDKAQAIIDVSTNVGEHIAQVFTGLMIRQLGEQRFTVQRVEGKAKEVAV
jgi:hypothetical protein